MKEAKRVEKGRSRVFYSVLSVVFPGLGQMVRGRLFAGLLFMGNALLYLVPIFIKEDFGYDLRTPALLIVLGVWVCSALDAFLRKSSFLALALLVSLFFFGSGFLLAWFLLPHIDY
jgi:hypothetical protein